MSAHADLAAPSRTAPPRTELAAAVILGAFLAYAALYYAIRGADLPHAGDFFALWSYGAILHAHPAADLYDPGRLHDLQVGLGMDPSQHNPFPYPPSALPVFAALGLLPVGAACALWTAAGLGAFACAVGGAPFRSARAAAALLAPTTTACVIAGQSGLLTGALLVGGMRLFERRPLLAGALFGLLTLKPQLGLLVPVALLAARAWRCAAAAAASALALAALGLAFGWHVWADWEASLSGYAAQYAAAGPNAGLKPTVLDNLAKLGAPAGLADAAQIAVAAGMAVLVWRLFRNGPGPRALAAFPAATLLATPHALVYDLPMLAGGVIIGLAARRPGSAGGAVWPVLALCLPPIMLWSQSWPAAPLLIAACLVWTVRR